MGTMVYRDEVATKPLPLKQIAMGLPAVVLGMRIACPTVLFKILMHFLCFIGSLFEPFDSVLPERGLVRFLVTTVQDARKAYNVEHGLASDDDQKFFEDF